MIPIAIGIVLRIIPIAIGICGGRLPIAIGICASIPMAIGTPTSCSCKTLGMNEKGCKDLRVGRDLGVEQSKGNFQMYCTDYKEH